MAALMSVNVELGRDAHIFIRQHKLFPIQHRVKRIVKRGCEEIERQFIQVHLKPSRMMVEHGRGEKIEINADL